MVAFAIFRRNFKQFFEEEGLTESGKPAWVNKTTHLSYLDKTKQLCFEPDKITYTRRTGNDDFIDCFIDDLGKYPREDLKLDFNKMRLLKPKEDENFIHS